MNRTALLSLVWFSCFRFATYSQETRVSEGAIPSDTPEPARNRLFIMSTGQTMPAGRFSFADFEIFLLQLGYAPTDFLHLNLSYLIPVSRGANTYWSIGTKVEVLQPSGLFQGLAIGADFGFFGNVDYITPASSYASSAPRLVNVNASVSVGDENVKMHASVAQLQWRSDYGKVQVPSYVQIGADALVHKQSASAGLKLMGELMFTQHARSLNPAFMILGLRTYSAKFTGDFGWPFGFGDSGYFVPAQIPFFSFTFFW